MKNTTSNLTSLNAIAYFFSIAIALLFFLSGCNVAEKALRSGNYDNAIEATVRKLRRSNDNAEAATLLQQAFTKATEEDNAQIIFWRKEGNPASWEKIYYKYESMESRQNLVKPLLPLAIKGKKYDFNMVDYSSELIESKQRFAEYLYANIDKLLAQNTKKDARKAFDYCQKLARFYPNYRDINNKTDWAKQKGTNFVLLVAEDQTHLNLPDPLVQEFIQFNNTFDNTWTKFHRQPLANTSYDFKVSVLLQQIDISPERLQERQYSQTRDIADGWEYAKDRQGKILLDSLGNKIKVTQYRQVSCQVQEVEQSKAARILGIVECRPLSQTRPLNTTPIQAEALFKHQYALFRGDREALDAPTRQLTQTPPMPFPTPIDLVALAKKPLKAAIQGAIRENSTYYN